LITILPDDFVIGQNYFEPENLILWITSNLLHFQIFKKIACVLSQPELLSATFQRKSGPVF
jgi:hypothetical protein